MHHENPLEIFPYDAPPPPPENPIPSVVVVWIFSETTYCTWKYLFFSICKTDILNICQIITLTTF